MHSATTLSHSLLSFFNGQGRRQAYMVGASILSIAVVLLEFSLRVPIKPAFDLYFHEVVASTSDISAFLCRMLTNVRCLQCAM